MKNQNNMPTATRAVAIEDTSVGTNAETPADELAGLAAWVVARVAEWRTHRDQNHLAAWEQYERLHRCLWSGQDKNKGSERSKFVSPALSEAVENSVAEIEEAVFGRGDFFEIRGEGQDNPDMAAATDRNKEALKEDLARTEYAVNVSECLINAAVFGTGVGEIVMKEKLYREPRLVQALPGVPPTMEVTEQTVTYACLHSVNPRNFVIDTNAKGIDDALGCAVEEYVGAHVIKAGQAEGVYRDVSIAMDQGDSTLIPDPQVQTEGTDDKVHIIRYYGLVPKDLLFPPAKTVDLLGNADKNPDSDEMVEAVVVVANKGVAIKAEDTPYLMQDRPVVAFPWDIVPGRFWGRGVCEKGAVPQRLLDAELRARMDALAYTSAPLMGMDASRLPRGFKLEVAPGRSILTNGNPKEVLSPFNFGQIDQNTWQQQAALDQMVQRATGSLDAVGLAKGVGDARSGATSMALSGVVKRHKRTMMNFVDRFLVPSLTKIMWRYMQFYPERYLPFNFSFVASSTMGIMQREYEMTNLVQLLQTMQPGTPEYRVVLLGIINNTGVANRAQLIEIFRQIEAREAQAAQAQMLAAQGQAADPMQMQLEAVKIELEIAEKRAKIADLEAQAALKQAKAAQVAQENQLEALKIATKGLYAVDEDQQASEFDKRYKLAQLALKQAEIDEKREDRVSNERIAGTQMSVSAATNERVQRLERALEQAKARPKFQVQRDEAGNMVGLVPEPETPRMPPAPPAFPMQGA